LYTKRSSSTDLYIQTNRSKLIPDAVLIACCPVPDCPEHDKVHEQIVSRATLYQMLILTEVTGYFSARRAFSRRLGPSNNSIQRGRKQHIMTLRSRNDAEANNSRPDASRRFSGFASASTLSQPIQIFPAPLWPSLPDHERWPPASDLSSCQRGKLLTTSSSLADSEVYVPNARMVSTQFHCVNLRANLAQPEMTNMVSQLAAWKPQIKQSTCPELELLLTSRVSAFEGHQNLYDAASLHYALRRAPTLISRKRNHRLQRVSAPHVRLNIPSCNSARLARAPQDC
jgi:hypothetical protein